MAGRAGQHEVQERARSRSEEWELYFKMMGMPSVAQTVPARVSCTGQRRAAEVVLTHFTGSWKSNITRLVRRGHKNATSFSELLGTRMSVPTASPVGRSSK